MKKLIKQCPKCHKRKSTKTGLRWRNGSEVQAFRCNNCGHIFVDKSIKRGK